MALEALFRVWVLVGYSSFFELWMDGVEDLHDTGGQNADNGNLDAGVHLKVPDKEDGENTECPIHGATDG